MWVTILALQDLLVKKLLVKKNGYFVHLFCKIISNTCSSQDGSGDKIKPRIVKVYQLQIVSNNNNNSALF